MKRQLPEIINEDILKFSAKPIKIQTKKQKEKTTGFRTSLDLEYLSERERRTTIFNKRSDGLVRKATQLMELTRAPFLLFMQNPDTLSLCLTKSHTMNIPAYLCLIGYIVKQFLELQKIDKSEFEEILERIVEKFENDKSSVKGFIDFLKNHV